MKYLPRVFLLTTALTLSACGQAGQQWLDPDKTFALFDQPVVKGVNATQEEMAKDAAAAGDFARAGQIYQQLVAGGKGAPAEQLRYKLGMAESARRLGNFDAALAMYDELSTAHGNHVEVLEGRGLTLMASGKAVDAGKTLASALEKDPKRWRTLNALGILFVSRNMIPEALAYYNEALIYSPNNAAVLNNMGLSHAIERNFPRAVEAMQKAVMASKAPSQRKQIELNLAMVLGVSGDLEGAREVANKYLEGAALDNNLGLYAHLAKDDALAKTYLNMALSQSSGFYQRAWDNLDTVNSQSGAMVPTEATPAATETENKRKR
jgi:Flp pilus assembly protein TadD